MGEIKTVDPAVEAVREAGRCLAEMDLLSPGKKGQDLFFTTGEPEDLPRGAAFGEELGPVEHIDLSVEGAGPEGAIGLDLAKKKVAVVGLGLSNRAPNSLPTGPGSGPYCL